MLMDDMLSKQRPQEEGVRRRHIQGEYPDYFIDMSAAVYIKSDHYPLVW